MAESADTGRGSGSPGSQMHYQVELDVFLILGYHIVSNGEVLDVEELLESSLSPGQQSAVAHQPLDERFSSYFQTLSSLYNAVAPLVPLSDQQSSVPKSQIELFQRFQQVLKEVLLSPDDSPYGPCFSKLDESHWKIKEDVRNPLWKALNESINKVYDRSTRTVTLTRPRKSAPTSAKHSPVLAARRKSVALAASADFSMSRVNSKLKSDIKDRDANTYCSVQGPFEAGSELASPTDKFVLPKAVSEVDSGSVKRQKVQDNAAKTEDAVEEILQMHTESLPKEYLPKSTVSTYERLIEEKDRHIADLKCDLEEQRKEIIWLKKLIMEDLKFVRSSLTTRDDS